MFYGLNFHTNCLLSFLDDLPMQMMGGAIVPGSFGFVMEPVAPRVESVLVWA